MKAHSAVKIAEVNYPLIAIGLKEKRASKRLAFKQIEDLRDKEVSVKLINDDLIEGVVKEICKDKISISKHGDWQNKIEINIEEIADLEASEYPYYSHKHKISLREEKKPRLPFRYSDDELKSLIGKYALVNYDGKVFDGKIIKTICNINKDKCNVIIVESLDGEVKEIQDYRLRDLEVTGGNLKAHQCVLTVRNIESDLYVELETNFSKGCPDALKNKRVEPDELIEKYFQGKIDELKGINVDFSGTDYNWANEVLYGDSIDNGKISKPLHHDVKSVRAVNKYYTTRKEFVDFIVEKVNLVDWTAYHKKQKDGVIEALEYIYESGVATS